MISVVIKFLSYSKGRDRNEFNVREYLYKFFKIRDINLVINNYIFKLNYFLFFIFFCIFIDIFNF